MNIPSSEPLESHGKPTIALLPYADLIDDFLHSLNISLETFCQEFVGSWMFGYVDALNRVGVRTILFCISAQVEKPCRFIHQPTGTQICVLPPWPIYNVYRRIRLKLLRGYGVQEGETFKNFQDSNSVRKSFVSVLKNLVQSGGSYLSTPLDLLAKELRKENCQAILCQEYEYARFDSSVLLGKWMGLPTYATFQGSDRTKSLIEVPGRYLALHSCAGVIVASQTEAARIRHQYGISASKIARIFNPLNVAAWQRQDQTAARNSLGIPVNAEVVVWHGRIDIQDKGLDILLEAWQQICCDRPDRDLRLLIVGTGTEADVFQERIEGMSLRGIQWLNQFVCDRTVIQRYLSAANIYAFPSRQEGFPVAPIEAMACSLPLVAADASGIADILEGGEDSGGIIVPRGDAAALAIALGRLLDDPAWSRELGDRARRRVERCFSPEVIGKQLREALLPNVVSPPAVPEIKVGQPEQSSLLF
ncbi:glycosyltransferase family 4 protein [Laspinema olomoucense]|uniref:glycosyltransferase family 4 protein n=1 Tax=Laspinema olomoucense TaxID=3231600 RepID=UPI0021BA7F00|nr:glycosyltransferase family 4 protein [Laspinema sp. D3d]MCT7970922.1 glycosyltransferase family 4 protein [Laspinema sp. D3d]